MKATDFMVGDLVRYGNINAMICKIILNQDYLEITYLDENNIISHRIVSYWELKPIPITQEILIKNGFERSGNEYSIEDEDDICNYVCISFNQSDESYCLFVGSIECKIGKPFKYVHELQHIIKIFGIRKQIVI